MKMDKDKSALLVIDMLNDFLYGKLKCERCRGIIGDIGELIDLAHKRNIPVIYICDSHKPDDPEFEKWPPHAVEGTKGAEIIDELKPGDDDYVVKKTRYSGFFETELDSLLRKLGVNSLILCGILTDICIQNTAADAFFRGYGITVAEECTETMSDDAKSASFDYMGDMYGAKIISLKVLL